MKTFLHHSITPLLLSAAAVCVLALSQMGGCATTGSQPSTLNSQLSSVTDKSAAFASSPTGQALANTLITVALDGALQYAASGKVDSRQLVANTLDGAAQNIRSLVNTPQVTSPNAVHTAAAAGINVRAISQQVAPLVAANVSRQIDNGTPPDQAIENLATVMNTAAAKTRSDARAP